MALILKTRPVPCTREITLPSAGYAYGDSLPAGKLLVQAFDWDAERVLFREPGTGSREMLRYVDVVNRVAKFPQGFDASNLLEGDLQYILLHARGLSYGTSYVFKSRCTHCRKEEDVDINIPDGMPMNRYPSDFPGTISCKLGEDDVEVRFITVKDDIECDNLTRQRISKKLIGKDAYDDDYGLHRLAMHIASVNGGRPDNLQETREWLKTLPVVQRAALTSFINELTPGASYKVSITCAHCSEGYEVMMPIGADFFRSGKRIDTSVLPGGVRIGVFGENELHEVSVSDGAEDNAPPPGGEETGGAKSAGGRGRTRP